MFFSSIGGICIFFFYTPYSIHVGSNVFFCAGVQVLTMNDVKFLRMAGGRGWTVANDVQGGGSVVFTEIKGGLVQET